ncbi:hypothetical protein OC861_005396 [Tilletia horrida]|nr:hypothetical protein OC861_005396 [Tilletia horrida]
MEEDTAGSRILVIDPFASPGDVASARRLEAIVELIIAQDHEAKHRYLNAVSQNDDAVNDTSDDGYAEHFDVKVAPSATSESQPLPPGSLHTKTKWHISNRYYDADVEFATLSLHLASESVTGSSKQPAEEQDKVNAALKTTCEGVPAVILLLTQARSEESHSALLRRVATAVEAYDLEVSLAISTATSAVSSADTVISSAPPVSSEETEKLVELYAEFGWEFIDLMAQQDDDDEEEEDAYKLTSVSAGEEEVFGIERVRQALSAHTWPGLKRRDDRRGRNALVDGPIGSALPDVNRSIIGFSDTPQDENDELADEQDDGAAYVKRLQERINDSYQALNLERDASGTTSKGDDFGPFQEGGESKEIAHVSLPTASTSAATSGLGSNGDDAFWTRGSSSAGIDEDFSSRFGPEPTSTAFFASSSAENDAVDPNGSGSMNRTVQDERLDAQDEAILSALSPDLIDEADQLHTELARMAFPTGASSNGDMEQLFGSMSSIKAHMDSNAARIQAIRDPVQQSREAAKFALAYTQMLMGGLDDEGGPGESSERDSTTPQSEQ